MQFVQPERLEWREPGDDSLQQRALGRDVCSGVPRHRATLLLVDHPIRSPDVTSPGTLVSMYSDGTELLVPHL